LAVSTPQQSWVILPTLGDATEALPGPFARETAKSLAGNDPYWSFTGTDKATPVTWYLAGTLPDWSGTPLALVVVLEQDNTVSAKAVGQSLFASAVHP
jgi:hypothetical protein